jgi:cell division protein FtsZ
MEGRMRVSVVATGIDAESMSARPPLESTPRRRPQATDPGMMSAVRSTQRRAEPAPEPAPESAMGQESVQRVASAPHPDRQPAAAERAAPEVAQTIETRAATTPSPDDIRARAEEVRQRAMAARAQRDAAHSRQAAVIDDEPELFDVDRGSLDTAPLRAEARSRVEPSLAADRSPERRAAAKPAEPESRGHGGRSGLFAINKLIHRVAGGGQAQSVAELGGETEHRADSVDEDEGEIPAFLRRQAN